MEQLPDPVSAPLEISVRADAGRLVVRPYGDIDIATGDVLSEQLDWALSRGFDEVLCDLREATFLDSTGIRILLSARQRCERRAIRFSISVADGPVHRALATAGVLEALQAAGS
jgi:anti-anti-sigma factor